VNGDRLGRAPLGQARVLNGVRIHGQLMRWRVAQVSIFRASTSLYNNQQPGADPM
jgi:hypothetical protein